MSNLNNENLWALIIGGSSGMGLATAKKLASDGINIFIIHKDRRSTLEQAEREFNAIRESGVELISFNKDGVNSSSIDGLVKEIATILEDRKGKIKVLLHSIAQGNLKTLIPTKPTEGSDELDGEAFGDIFPMKNDSMNIPSLRKQDFDLTLNSMGVSLFDWVRLSIEHNLFAEHGRVIGLTSEGNTTVWSGYAAVASAKSVLETLIKYFAVELAPYHITANLVQAGVTDTPSLTMIPGSDFLKEYTLKRNPNKRLTTPADVANVIYLLCKPEANWINGTTIIADGGEHLI